MELSFLHNTKFDFIGKRYIFFAISLGMILAGIISLAIKGGPKLGIDFSGGTLLQIAFEQPIDINSLRSALTAEDLTKSAELQSSQNNSVIIRIKRMDISQDEIIQKVNQILSAKYANQKTIIERVEFVGPAVGEHLIKQAFLAIMLSFVGIIIYVAFRFHSGIWGFAGVLALVHDVFIVVGLFSIFDKEITLTVIAALLTLAGYSINDTIVIFDRIRENMRLMAKEDMKKIINDSVNQTISRSIITSLTVFMVVAILFFFGGEVIHDFSFALLTGVIVGSYSTIYVASPLIYEWILFQKRRSSTFLRNKK